MLNQVQHDTMMKEEGVNTFSNEVKGEQEECFKGIPYATIIREWLAQTGGEPVKGERNDRLHRLAAHLRYICDDDEELMLRIMPRYGLDEAEMRALIHSAIVAKRCMTPKVMKEILANHSNLPSIEGGVWGWV